MARWVDECARLTQPDRVVWCDGSEEEYRRFVGEMVRDGTFHALDPAQFPGCYLYRSHPSDVARTEHLTFICTGKEEDAGPTNNWMSPAQAEEKVGPILRGCMKGRTLYVVPYLLGPADSPHSKVGVQVTDSLYVVVNLRLMTRMGSVALDRLGASDDFVRGLHSLGDLSPDRRFICHFPERKLIWSVGTGYGGNALLPKKCFSLRIAGWLARQEGWMAEHMLIMGIEDPAGEVTYIAAAFPSACGKSNLAMLVPPASQKGWKVWTVGDDIAWMHLGPDGRLYAVNPEAGFFAVAPGTSSRTNPNMMATVRRNAIFSNVALAPGSLPWWEGMDGPVPESAIDWRGRPWKPGGEKAAHPNARMTAPARQCPCISPRFDDPQGVPISAILFGARRSRLAPLVYQTFDWTHGVYVGASMASETTAAAAHNVGVMRRDPMAMIPFCGYNMADYFRHWLDMGKRGGNLPSVFHVNWFRVGEDDKFLWPGFGENLRVLRWVIDRVRGRGGADRTPIGYVPSRGAIDLSGLDLPAGVMDELCAVDREEWKAGLKEQEAFFGKFGDRFPAELKEEHAKLSRRLS